MSKRVEYRVLTKLSFRETFQMTVGRCESLLDIEITTGTLLDLPAQDDARHGQSGLISKLSHPERDSFSPLPVDNLPVHFQPQANKRQGLKSQEATAVLKVDRPRLKIKVPMVAPLSSHAPWGVRGVLTRIGL